MANDTVFALEKEMQALADRLRQGEVAAEARFTAVFTELANGRLNDPPRLAALVEAVLDLPLRTAVARQQRQFFQALAQRKQGEYQPALAAFDDLLAHPHLAPEIEARAINSRAVTLELMGQLEAAFNGYHQSLARWQALGNRRQIGMVRLNMGILAYKLRQYEEAENHLQKAAAHFKVLQLPEWELAAVNELGVIHRDRGQWEAALACFEAVIGHHRQAHISENLAIGLQNKGEVLLFLGRLDEAEAVLTEALERMQAQTYRVDIHLHLGLIHQARGQLELAESAFRAALADAADIGREEILPHVYFHLGDIRRRQGDHTAAKIAWETAVTLVESARRPMQKESLKISLLGRWGQIYEALLLLCLEEGDMAAAYYWAEQIRARALLEAMGTTGPTIAGLAQVQAALPAGTAIWVYFTTGVLAGDVPLLQAIPADNPLRPHLLLPARVILFAITRQTAVAHICAIDPNKLGTVSRQRANAARFLPPPILERLYTELVAPAVDGLAAARLILVPHGPLHQVPFTAVLAQHPTPPPILTYALSGTMPGQTAPRPPATRPCLAVGYGGGQRPLPYADLEAAQVARQMGGAVWAENREPLPQAAAPCRLLHFACHAHFDPDVPLASTLEVGPGRSLTAQTILDKWTLRADLVVLSACESGVSHILRGDEPMGLVRAFLAAGARAVLVTQWPVEDLPTFLFMSRFYEELARESAWDLGLALHRSQQWLQTATAVALRARLPAAATGALLGMADTAVPFAAPAHWAGFLLIGS